MKWVIVLFVVTTMLAMPAVSAENTTITTTGYTVRPSTEGGSNSILISDSIVQGQTKTYYTNVGANVNWLEVDLNWGDRTDSLSLTLNNPSGGNVGTFYDINDGVIDGRIHIDIVPNQGYVEAGQWKYKVYGVSVVGTEDYTFNVYQH